MTGLLHRPDDAASLAAALRRIGAGSDDNREMGRAARLRYGGGFSEVGLARLEEGYARRSRDTAGRTRREGTRTRARAGGTCAGRGWGSRWAPLPAVAVRRPWRASSTWGRHRRASFSPRRGWTRAEPAYPLHLRVCTDCWLAQLPPLITPEETFSEYASTARPPRPRAGLRGGRGGAAGARRRLVRGGGGEQQQLSAAGAWSTAGVPLLLGVEPWVNVGAAAREAGVPTLTAFLSPETGAAVRAEHGPGGPGGRQQRVRAHPRCHRLHQGAALPDGRLPAHWADAKAAVEELRARTSPTWCSPRAPRTRTRTTGAWRS
ncbi:hypothetical protein SALBM217S_05096 [Streptomyces griseoloalbus]